MSRLLVNSVANFGKLMRNVGTKNYSTECSPALNRLKDHLDKVEESKMSKLKTIGDFNIISMNKETKIVTMVKDLPNMKMNIMFNMDMPCIWLDKKKFWSNLELVEEPLKLQSCGDVKFHSENDSRIMKGMTENDTFVVELDKGQSKNFVAVMSNISSRTKFYMFGYGMMSKVDEYLNCPECVDSEDAEFYVTDILKGYGFDHGICKKLDEWQNEWSISDFDQIHKVRKFFTF